MYLYIYVKDSLITALVRRREVSILESEMGCRSEYRLAIAWLWKTVSTVERRPSFTADSSHAHRHPLLVAHEEAVLARSVAAFDSGAVGRTVVVPS